MKPLAVALMLSIGAQLMPQLMLGIKPRLEIKTVSDPQTDKIPKTQAALTGGPPRPPVKTARGLGDEPPNGRHIDIPDPVKVEELATALGQKPYRIIFDMIKLHVFASPGSFVDFETAAKVARKHGFEARRID